MRYGALEGGGTKMAAAVLEGNRIGERVQFPTRTPGETLPELAAWFRERKIGALGIASFGPVDLDTASPTYGYITSTPKIPWQMCDILGYFRRELGVPCAFDTDVNAAALSEWRLGAARGADPMLYVTVGTGIGGGAVINGRLLHGAMHPEWGHILIAPHPEDPMPEGNCPFHRGCLEGLASGPAMQKRWGMPAGELPDDHPGWEMEAYYLAQLCVAALMTLSVRKIVLGGGVMGHRALYEKVRVQTEKLLGGYLTSPNVRDMEKLIVPPALWPDSGLVGAALLTEQDERITLG